MPESTDDRESGRLFQSLMKGERVLEVRDGRMVIRTRQPWTMLCAYIFGTVVSCLVAAILLWCLSLGIQFVLSMLVQPGQNPRYVPWSLAATVVMVLGKGLHDQTTEFDSDWTKTHWTIAYTVMAAQLIGLVWFVFWINR